MADWRILVGDAREQLARLPEQYVQCIVTSPPYWGLRDYGREGQIGLEPTPDAYVQSLLAVFRDVRRVLKDDGTLWLNLGDCYQSGSRGGYDRERSGVNKNHGQNASDFACAPNRMPQAGLKDKDLVGIPWRVAFALQADGWYLRSDIIWAKAHEFCPGGVGSTMPMGGKKADRPTPAHEYLFLLSKSPHYFYDEEAVKQPGVYAAGTRAAKGSGKREGNRRASDKRASREYAVEKRERGGANDGYAIYSGRRRLRDVWFISPQPYAEAHFATFPPKLVEPCILAGSAVGSVVLDPFCGSGTTGLVATQLGRHFLGIDLKAEYRELGRQRIRAGCPDAREIG
jgi:DNA modification methylase